MADRLPAGRRRHANPHAFEYLYRDLTNVGNWFARRGAPIPVDELYAELIATAGTG